MAEQATGQSTAGATMRAGILDPSTPHQGQTFPRWLIRIIWATHRAVYRLSGGKLALRPAKATQWGTLHLTTVGRRSGRQRVAIVGFIEDGPNLVTPAMNGWLEPDPAWWLNLQSKPQASVRLPGGETRVVTARAAVGDERDRLWRAFLALGSSAFTEDSPALRRRETAIVVLEPQLG